MKLFLKIAAAIDEINLRVTFLASWLTLAMVLVQFLIVVSRYVFGTGSVQLQESILYMHGILFLIAAGGTLLADEHVRVDIFYRGLSFRHRAWVNLIGSLVFLMPVCLLILVNSWNYVGQSWTVMEGSRDPGGIQAIYLLKTFILLFGIGLGAQGLSQAIKALAVLTGHHHEPQSGAA